MSVIHHNTFVDEMYHKGIDVTMEEVETLIEGGVLPVDREGYLVVPNCYKAFQAWLKAGKPEPGGWMRTIIDSRPLNDYEREQMAKVGTSSSAGTPSLSGDAGEQLGRLVEEAMKKDPKLSYIDALNLTQKANPELAQKISESLDVYRNRNKK